MKRVRYITGIMLLLASLLLSSCNDFLGILPKGEKIPTTLADYEAFIRNDNNHRCDFSQAMYLMNDFYISTNTLNTLSLDVINYNWMENQDRIRENDSDEGAYYYTYGNIFYWNLMIRDVPEATECTEEERQELIAQAKVLRAMDYFNLLNYYADPYEESTAAEKLSVPLITSPDMGAASEQVTIARMYEFILTDLTEALPYLPEESETVLHPTLGAGYAMLARVYLTMENYEDALTYAELALEQNNALYDWRQYYEENREQLEAPDDYSTSYPAIGLDNVENYLFRYGTNNQKNFGQSGTTNSLTTWRAAQFEKGDARLASKWKWRYMSPDTIYYGIRNDRFNGGGLSTPEMYYIQAECIARQGGQDNIDEAMGILNDLRHTRFFDEDYHELSATSVEEAVQLIIRDKANEYIQTPIPFWDARRLNLHPEYATTRTKTYNGQTLTLAPDSHLWTMPFPLGATSNPGNGTLQQNVER